GRRARDDQELGEPEPAPVHGPEVRSAESAGRVQLETTKRQVLALAALWPRDFSHVLGRRLLLRPRPAEGVERPRGADSHELGRPAAPGLDKQGSARDRAGVEVLPGPARSREAEATIRRRGGPVAEGGRGGEEPGQAGAQGAAQAATARHEPAAPNVA